MALLHFNGFEYGQSSSPALDGYGYSGVIYTAGTTPRTGSWHMQLNGNATFLRYDLSTQHATAIVGVAKKSDGISGINNIFQFKGDAAATTHITITQNLSNNEFKVYRGTSAGTLLATWSALGLFNTLSYNYFEAKAVLDDTIGSVELRVNGAVIGVVSGVDTKNAGTLTTFSSIELGQTVNANSFWDDFYVLNGAGPAPYNDFLGEVRIEALRPNGNGTYSQLVGQDGDSISNYLNVDEGTPTATDYNGSATDGALDTYALNDLASTSVTVHAVSVQSFVWKSDAGVKSGRTVIRTNGTDYTSTDHLLGTSSLSYRTDFLLNPNTGVAWTPAEINALEAGFEVRP